MPFGFSGEQEALREMLAAYVRKTLAPGYRERAVKEAFPWDIQRELGRMGVLGIGLPVEYGGTGSSDPVALGIACEELGYGDPTMAAAPTLVGLVGSQLARRGTRVVKERYLPQLVAGESLVSLAFTEADAGLDVDRLGTVARRVDSGWLLSGEKTSVPQVRYAEAAIVYARQPGTSEAKGVSAFVVPLDAPGVRIGTFHDMGASPLARGTLVLDDVFVPDDHLLRAKGGNFRLIVGDFDCSWAAIGLQCIGAARASVDETATYAGERVVLGKPIAGFPRISCSLAEHATYLEAARWLCYRALSLRQQNRPSTAEASMCRWWAPRVAVQAIEACLGVYGPAVFWDELPIQQRLRDVMGYFTADGTAEVQKLVIAGGLMSQGVSDQ